MVEFEFTMLGLSKISVADRQVCTLSIRFLLVEVPIPSIGSRPARLARGAAAADQRAGDGGHAARCTACTHMYFVSYVPQYMSS
jgi:hypothetical protein